jgi:hypothetical protein
VREWPEPQLLLAGRPQAGNAVRLLDQEEDDQPPKMINSACEPPAVDISTPTRSPIAGSN